MIYKSFHRFIQYAEKNDNHIFGEKQGYSSDYRDNGIYFCAYYMNEKIRR